MTKNPSIAKPRISNAEIAKQIQMACFTFDKKVIDLYSEHTDFVSREECIRCAIVANHVECLKYLLIDKKFSEKLTIEHYQNALFPACVIGALEIFNYMLGDEFPVKLDIYYRAPSAQYSYLLAASFLPKNKMIENLLIGHHYIARKFELKELKKDNKNDILIQIEKAKIYHSIQDQRSSKSELEINSIAHRVHKL